MTLVLRCSHCPINIISVVLAALVFGRRLRNRHVLLESNYTTVVAAIQKVTCRKPHVMQLLRILYFVAAHYGLTFTPLHLPSSRNAVSYAVSRNLVNRSLVHCTQLNLAPLPGTGHHAIPTSTGLCTAGAVCFTIFSYRFSFIQNLGISVEIFVLPLVLCARRYHSTSYIGMDSLSVCGVSS